MASKLGGQTVSFVLPSHRPEIAYADALYHAGQYRKALSVVQSLPAAPERELFCARVLYRLGRNDEARALLTQLRNAPLERALQVECSTLLALVEISAGHLAPATAALNRVDDVSFQAMTTPQRYEIEHARAMLHWAAGAPRKALDIIRNVSAEDDHGWAGKLLIMRGWIAASNNQFVEQARLLHEGILVAQRAAVVDVGVLARALHGLAAILREVPVPDILDSVINIAQQFPWTEDLRVHEFHTLRAIGWANVLRGQNILGIRAINRAKELAPLIYGSAVAEEEEAPAASHWVVLSHLDHSYIARAAGEPATAEAELLDAHDRLQDTDWSNVAGEESVALLVAAELFAASHPRRSTELLEKYLAVRDTISNISGFKHNGRLAAMEEYVRAAIAHAFGDHRAALSHAAAAYRQFSEMAHAWRAARAALIAHENGGGRLYLEHAASAIEPYPRSFIAQEVEKKKARAERPILGALTPKQREVFDVLCSGASATECGDRLGITESTVRGHIKAIHRAFGVKSRSQLLTAAARLGFISSPHI
jgi:DNA-binding CsgD family transcriptional regulator